MRGGAFSLPPGAVAALALLAALAVALPLAIGIVIAFKGDAEPFVPAGYFGEVTTLSESAATDLARIAPADVLARCLGDDATACDQQQRNARAGQARMTELSGALALLDPPVRAREWHGQYIAAIVELAASLDAQAAAIEARDRDLFVAAVERTRSAVETEQSLNDRFNVDFADQIFPA